MAVPNVAVSVDVVESYVLFTVYDSPEIFAYDLVISPGSYPVSIPFPVPRTESPSE